MANSSNCDTCVHYVYDEESEEYWCMANMDEDDVSRLFSGNRSACRFYQVYDEYKTVRKQN